MKYILVLVTAVLLQACVSSKFVSSNLIDPELNLAGKSVLAYNTLDIRVRELGDKMLASLNNQLKSKLDSKKVKTDILNFKSSDIGTSYMVSGSGVIPIDDFVSQYRDKEIADEFDYRLLIIPSQMTVSGSWRFFDITWILVDVKSNLPVWKGISKGEHLVQWSINEMPEKRASLIVDSLMLELEKSKVF